MVVGGVGRGKARKGVREKWSEREGERAEKADGENPKQRAAGRVRAEMRGDGG